MPFHVLALSGSLRRGSHNTALLRHAASVAPAGLTITIHSLAGVPLYDDDVYQQGFPAAVHELREAIRAADGLLIATPEYNYSFPGVLKNAIDWCSRPKQQPFAGKPTAIMGAGAAMYGTGRAQMQLRQVLFAVNCHVINTPEVTIPAAEHAFDAEGRLIDERADRGVRRLLDELVTWMARLQQTGA